MISFARSGDSTESMVTLELAKELCDQLYALNITCNEGSEMAKLAGNKNTFVVFLSEETNDRSLAMSSSFSSMLLVGLLILNIKEIGSMESVVGRICDFGRYILAEHLHELKKIARNGLYTDGFFGIGATY